MTRGFSCYATKYIAITVLLLPSDRKISLKFKEEKICKQNHKKINPGMLLIGKSDISSVRFHANGFTAFRNVSF